MSFHYDWPMASPCSAILIYVRKGTKLNLLTTRRSASVGTGRSLSAGGFYEVKDMFNKKTGARGDGRLETYREMVEELGDAIKKILPYDDFQDRVNHLWDGMVATEDPDIIHSVTFRTLEVSQKEMDAILALPNTDEQTGKMVEIFELQSDTPQETQLAHIAKRLSDFKYPHEIWAVQQWYKKMSKLAAPKHG